MKVIIIVSITVLLLAGCDNQPDIKPAEAIRLAKQAASLLPSPPRLYNPFGYNKDHPYTEALKQWPDEPAAKSSGCVDACYIVVTYTTEVIPSNDHAGRYVNFNSQWQGVGGGNHSWHFFVGNDQQVKFIREGAELPMRPEFG